MDKFIEEFLATIIAWGIIAIAVYVIVAFALFDPWWPPVILVRFVAAVLVVGGAWNGCKGALSA